MPSIPVIYVLDLEKYEFNNPTQNLERFNLERDSESWIDIFVREFDLERNEVEEHLFTIIESENLLKHIILYHNGLLVGTGAIALKKGSKVGRLIAIYGSNTKYLKEILAGLARMGKEKSIAKLSMTFTHLESDSEKILPYTELGFKKVKFLPSEINLNHKLN